MDGQGVGRGRGRGGWVDERHDAPKLPVGRPLPHTPCHALALGAGGTTHRCKVCWVMVWAGVGPSRPQLQQPVGPPQHSTHHTTNKKAAAPAPYLRWRVGACEVDLPGRGVGPEQPYIVGVHAQLLEHIGL